LKSGLTFSASHAGFCVALLHEVRAEDRSLPQPSIGESEILRNLPKNRYSEPSLSTEISAHP